MPRQPDPDQIQQSRPVKPIAPPVAVVPVRENRLPALSFQTASALARLVLWGCCGWWVWNLQKVGATDGPGYVLSQVYMVGAAYVGVRAIDAVLKALDDLCGGRRQT